MQNPIEISVSIEETLLRQAEMLAEQLHVAPNQLFEMALAHFVAQHPAYQPGQMPARPIHQGDVYWAQTENPGMAHPHVVVQADVLNHSRIATVVVCAVTSNTRKLNMPGNILLDVAEANLSRPSVVEVSKVSSIAKAQLGAYIGSLPDERLQQIFAGMRFVQMSFPGSHNTP